MVFKQEPIWLRRGAALFPNWSIKSDYAPEHFQAANWTIQKISLNSHKTSRCIGRAESTNTNCWDKLGCNWNWGSLASCQGLLQEMRDFHERCLCVAQGWVQVGTARMAAPQATSPRTGNPAGEARADSLHIVGGISSMGGQCQPGLPLSSMEIKGRRGKEKKKKEKTRPSL